MKTIEFSADERTALVKNIQRYFQDELDQEIDPFPAEFLLGFITGEIGPYFYNRGLLDAQVVLQDRLDSLGEAIDELQQPTPR